MKCLTILDVPSFIIFAAMQVCKLLRENGKNTNVYAKMKIILLHCTVLVLFRPTDNLKSMIYGQERSTVYLLQFVNFAASCRLKHFNYAYIRLLKWF